MYGLYDTHSRMFVANVISERKDEIIKKGAELARIFYGQTKNESSLTDKKECEVYGFLPLVISYEEQQKILNNHGELVDIEVTNERLILGQLVNENRLEITIIQ